MRHIGKVSAPPKEALAKVTGRAIYTHDFTLPDMLWGAILRSPHPHARIVALDTSRANLQKMIDLSRGAGAKVLLLGMKIPPNYGPRYANEFEGLYAELARRNKLAFEPFFLDKIALADGMMQEDGIHPTAKAQPIMLETLWPRLTPLLRR